MASETLTSGFDAVGERAYSLKVKISELEKICNVKEGDARRTSLEIEKVGVDSVRLLNRCRKAIDHLMMKNSNGTDIKFKKMSVSLRKFGKYQIWVASVGYEQIVADEDGNETSHVVRIDIPIDDVHVYLGAPGYGISEKEIKIR